MAFDFPENPTVGQASNGYAWDGSAWTGGGIKSGLADAPLDNILYGRQMGAWVKAVKSVGDTMTGDLVIDKASPVIHFNNVVPSWTISGGDIGDANNSIFSIKRFDATGVPQGSAFSIDRTSGLITVAGSLDITTATPVITFTGAGTESGTLKFKNGGFEYWKIAGDLNALMFHGLNSSGVLTPVFGLDRNLGVVAKRAAAGTLLTFQVGTTTVGSISTDGASTTYNTSSSAELKTDLKDFDPGPILDALKVYDFAWVDTGKRAYGVIAQEAIEVYPHAVTHTAAGWWGVDYALYMPLVLQELKMLRERVRQLEAERI
jgi:Chaperone of endosialidase